MPRTRWRIKRTRHWPDELAVDLTIDTTAPVVVAAIEQAAAENGIELERLVDQDEFGRGLGEIDGGGE